MEVSETLNTGANAERIKIQQQELEAAEQALVEPIAESESKPDYLAALEKINNPGQ